ncbi:M23 family metallopeptidase [Helcococcus bovis]|uniref:M23 family metallopeptidase n=1 Tax=Helcococcus bovis TaxID=3153252 RepID=UPI0038B7520B
MKNTLFLAMRLVGAILGFFSLTTFCVFFVFMFFFLIINSIFNFGDNGKTEFLENQIVYNTEIGKLIKPTTGVITDTFGLRIHPITGEVGNFHRGIDIANEIGTKIYATKEGTVTISQADDSGYGLWVEIDHGNNVKTRYAHLSQTKVMVNQKVLQGQLIGLMGSTGMSTGSHLHFEIRINNEAVNPEKYIKFR